MAAVRAMLPALERCDAHPAAMLDQVAVPLGAPRTRWLHLPSRRYEQA